MAEGREARGLAYWSSQPATNDGVLGGYGRLNRVDALASRLFIQKALPAVRDRQADPTRLFRACDTGAGVGRVTLNTLLPLFDRIDLVENVEKFVEQARVSVSRALDAKKGTTGVRFWTQSLQDFDPAAVARAPAGDVVGAKSGWGSGEGYDLIWNQWTLGHLDDAQLVAYLGRCAGSLRAQDSRRRGVIVVKENCCQGADVYDDDDHSWTRSEASYGRIFERAHLRVIMSEWQQGFPSELFSVKTWALVPASLPCR